MALLSISSGCTPRASLIGVESNGQLESLRSPAVYKQKNTCSRQRIVKVAGPRGALLCVPFTHISRRVHAARHRPRAFDSPCPLPLPTHPLLGQVKSRTTIWLCSSVLITLLPLPQFCAFKPRHPVDPSFTLFPIIISSDPTTSFFRARSGYI